MSEPVEASDSEASRLEEFDQELARSNLRGQWQVDRLLQAAVGGPPPAGSPFLWKWGQVFEKLSKACQVMPESRTARRNISFVNPGLEPGRGVTTRTLTAGMQIVQPGEVAESHRHTIAALRFVIQGDKDVSTVVDGQPFRMENFDLIFTPAWSWHAHRNDSAQPAIWLDVLDSPLVMGLNQVFFESRDSETRPILSRQAGMRFAWDQMEAELHKISGSKETPPVWTSIPYLDPETGKSPLSTLGCSIQRLAAGEETPIGRRTSSSIHFVIRGQGVTAAGDQELAWSEQDSFAIPNWTRLRHTNASASEEAILLTVDDIPLLENLGLYREEG